jgi:hypothetical protein
MTVLCQTLAGITCAALLFAAPAAAEDAAPDMKNPRVNAVDADWGAARAAAASLAQSDAGTQAPGALAQLNAATAKVFPKIGASGVPVLLPFDTGAFLRDRVQGDTGDADKYFADFHAPTFFFPGPSGYDAAFRIPLKDSSVHPAEVQISASSVIYELDGTAADQGAPVLELEHDFPGIRRVLLENRLRYVFTRFGVPYFVSIPCSDGRRARHITCREADGVALRFLKTLNLVGGAPASVPTEPAAQTVEQPGDASPDFTFYAPGDILPGTGMNGRSGRDDATVYADIRFPMARAPAYINSQSFMNWGNCDLTGLVRLGGHGREAAYRCRVNDIRLLNDETKNYAYPWRDNFCEHRHYQVTQCPGGLGHQGEDIRPSTCKLHDDGADRCEPYQDEVVAVRDGMVWRSAGDEALYLTTDAPGQHVRFRYLHMNPHMLDLAGMVSGRALSAGEVLGPVGNYGAREGGTSYHLHFNMQVPTRQGWVFVNPYMTLVAAYQRLIGGRGQVVNDTMLAPPAPSAGIDAAPGSSSLATSQPATPDGMVQGTPGAQRAEAQNESSSERRHHARQIVAEHCATRFVKGHRRRLCRADVAEIRGRGRHPYGVRTVDRRVSLQGDRARHHAGDLRSRHERGRTRHNRA